VGHISAAVEGSMNLEELIDMLTHIRGQPNVSPLTPVFLAVGEGDNAPLVPITTIEMLLDKKVKPRGRLVIRGKQSGPQQGG
jgi:hypothetical protein